MYAFRDPLGKLLRVFSFKLPQNRHPERSAAQMDRGDTALGARSRRTLGNAQFTHAARSFSTTGPRHCFSLGSRTTKATKLFTPPFLGKTTQRVPAREEARPHWHDQSRIQRPCTDLGMEDDYCASKISPPPFSAY